MHQPSGTLSHHAVYAVQQVEGRPAFSQKRGDYGEVAVDSEVVDTLWLRLHASLDAGARGMGVRLRQRAVRQRLQVPVQAFAQRRDT